MRKINKIKELIFHNKSAKQTIFKNVFWLSFSQVASRFIRAAIIIYAARVLGAAGYGVFSYALGLSGFFTIFADIGLTQILTRETSQKPDKKSKYFATTLILKLMLLLGTAIVILIAAPHFSKIPEAKALIPLIAFLTIFDGLRDLSIGFLRGLEKMELEALIIIFMNIMIAVSGFAIISFSATAKSLTLSYVVSTGVGALTAFIILRKEFLNTFKNFSRELIKPILNSALPIALISLLGAFMLNTDYIMLGWWRSPEEIGFYSAGQKIIQVLYTLPTIVASSIFPAIARFVSQKKEQETKNLMERSVTLMFFLAFPLVIGGIILGSPLIKLLYGNAYLPATLSFQILLSTLLIYFPAIIISNTVLAYDKQKKIAPFIGLGSLVNIGLNALLIPPFGIAGSSIGTFFALLSVNGPIWIIMKKTAHFEIMHHLKKLIFAVLIMGIISFVLNKIGVQVLINIAISGLAYVAILLLFKEYIILESINTIRRVIKH